jgi:hypothetical protein
MAVVEQVTIDAAEPGRLARFWCAVLDWQVLEDTGDEIAIGGDDARVPGILLVRVPDAGPGRAARTAKNRLHLDLRPGPGREEAEEIDRIIALGARRVDIGQPDDAPWTVLADPEGNEFCLLRP